MENIAILAGGRYFINSTQKNFLRLNKKIIVENVIDAAIKCKPKTICIVAPRNGIKEIKKIYDTFEKKKNIKKTQIIYVNQGRNIAENIILAKSEVTKKLKLKKSEIKNLGLYYLFADTPFRSEVSIKEFIRLTKKSKSKLVIGQIDEKHVKKYMKYFKKPLFPVQVNGKPGMFKENNMFYFDPDYLIPELTNEFYNLRHTTRLLTIIKIRRLIKKHFGGRALKILYRAIFLRQWNKLFEKIHKDLARPKRLYKVLDKEDICKYISKKLGFKFDLVYSKYPDGFIDIDSEEDYKILKSKFKEINKMMKKDLK